MKFLNFSILKLTFCLILGVLSGFYFKIDAYVAISVVSLLILLSVLSNLIKRHLTTFVNRLTSILVLVLLVGLGILTVSLHDEKQFKNHYSKFIPESDAESHLITFRIREVLKPGLGYNKYLIDILKIDENLVRGKSLLNIKADSTTMRLDVDELFITKTEFEEIRAPLNPHQFNYKDYMEKRYVYNQLYVSRTNLIPLGMKTRTLFGYADTIRQKIYTQLVINNFKDDELAIITALFLGQRKDISKEIYNNYAQAGVIHILAVSGLHVGIILLLLTYLLKPLDTIKKGRYFRLLILILSLWTYAVLAGLSASVVRAVTMFTAVAIGMNLNKQTNIYNTLAISAFVLLLFKPLFLFDVGFQLSYLAVLSIVTFQPILYKLWNPKRTLFRPIFKILTVTVSAQLGVLPVSLYYFHQFPGLFFLSNLVIIPFLSAILGTGIIVIILALFNILPEFLASFFSSIIWVLNRFVSWVAQQESFLFKDISFSLIEVILSYLLIITAMIWLKTRIKKYLIFLLVSVLLLQVFEIGNNVLKGVANRFVVLHKSRNSMIVKEFGSKMEVYVNHDSLFNDQLITNYSIGERIKNIEYETLPDYFVLKDKLVLSIDSNSIYKVKSKKVDIVLLRNSPKLNLNRLIDSLNPKLIIVDGSNYYSLQERWKTTCAKRQLPYHQTATMGAYILDY